MGVSEGCIVIRFRLQAFKLQSLRILKLTSEKMILLCKKKTQRSLRFRGECGHEMEWYDVENVAVNKL